MQFKTIGYALLVGAAAVAFSMSPADAKHKKKAAAPPPAQPQVCLYDAMSPVCGSLKGHKFTYANQCAAWKDGATIVSNKACPAKAAKHKKGKKGKKKKGKKKY